MERLMQKLPPYAAGLGLLGLLVALGLYQAGSGPDRYAVPVAAASVALLLYYVVERPQAILRAFTGRTAKYGGNTLVMSIAFIVILALVNVLAARFSYRLDLTENQQFTLSPQTVKILTELNQPVKLTAFYTNGSDQQLKDVLKQFAQHTNELRTQYVDPQLQPGLARQYDIQYNGTTVIEANGKRQTVTGYSEGDLISGILKVTRNEPKKVYFITGHGEPDSAGTDQNGFSGVKQALEAESYTVEPLNLVSAGKVPQDASLVILAGPTHALLPQETQAFTDYLDNGGKALVLGDSGHLAGLPELLARYGVEIANGFVVELGQSLPNEPLAPIIAGGGYLSSPITNSLPAMTILPTADLVRAKSGTTDTKYTVTPIAQTTDRSWLETDLSNTQLSFDPAKDVQGPISVAVTVTSSDASQTSADQPKKSTRLVVVGDVDFATNNVLNWEGNRDFLVNSVNWLAEDENLIGVRAKTPASRQMMLTSGQMSLVMYSSIIVLPLLVLGGGAWIVWGRKK